MTSTETTAKGWQHPRDCSFCLCYTNNNAYTHTTLHWQETSFQAL